MANIIPVAAKFNQRLTLFLQAFEAYIGKKVSYEMGTKYVKILTGSYGNETAHGFIDFSGNIHKINSWRTPDKKIRGNIFDDNFGIETAIDFNGIKRPL